MPGSRQGECLNTVFTLSLQFLLRNLKSKIIPERHYHLLILALCNTLYSEFTYILHLISKEMHSRGFPPTPTNLQIVLKAHFKNYSYFEDISAFLL